VVRDPAGISITGFHRLLIAFVGLLDGSRTVSEAWDSAGGVLADDAPTSLKSCRFFRSYMPPTFSSRYHRDAGRIAPPARECSSERP